MLGRVSCPVRWEGPPTCRTERSGKVKGTMGRGFGVKKGWREGKLERRRRTPVQPESAMRGGADDREERAEADVVVSACAGGMLWHPCYPPTMSHSKPLTPVITPTLHDHPRTNLVPWKVAINRAARSVFAEWEAYGFLSCARIP